MSHFERIDPDDRNTLRLTRFGHIERYRLVAQLIEFDTIVLDAACGYGYGSRIISQKAHSVVGLDQSEEVIQRCKKSYSHLKNLEFIVGDVEKLPFSDEKFDIVAGIEMIEHITKPHLFLQEVRRTLKPGGYLMISTPYGNNTLLKDGKPYSLFHVKEFTKAEMIDLLMQNDFSVRQTFGQYIVFGILLRLTSGVIQPSSDISEGRLQALLNMLPFVPQIFSKHYKGVLKKTAKNMFYVAQKPQ